MLLSIDCNSNLIPWFWALLSQFPALLKHPSSVNRIVWHAIGFPSYCLSKSKEQGISDSHFRRRYQEVWQELIFQFSVKYWFFNEHINGHVYLLWCLWHYPKYFRYLSYTLFPFCPKKLVSNGKIRRVNFRLYSCQCFWALLSLRHQETSTHVSPVCYTPYFNAEVKVKF